MTRTSRIAIAVVVAMGALLVNDKMSITQPSSLVSEAEARIGRPLSPMSVAGVARRQTRRAVYGGGYYGGAFHRGGLYGAGIVATGGALVIARNRANWGNYGYGGWSDYASRNGITCEPGTYVRLQDGQQYLCQ